MQILISKEELWNAFRELALRTCERDDVKYEVTIQNWERVAREVYDLIIRTQMCDYAHQPDLSSVLVTSADFETMIQFKTADWNLGKSKDGKPGTFTALPEPGTMSVRLSQAAKQKAAILEKETISEKS